MRGRPIVWVRGRQFSLVAYTYGTGHKAQPFAGAALGIANVEGHSRTPRLQACSRFKVSLVRLRMGRQGI